MNKRYTDYKEAANRFRYDRLTGVFYRIHPTREEAIYSKDSKGYIRLSFNIKGRRVVLTAHRVAVFVLTGRIPKGQIDHISGIRDDNRPPNLREVTNAQNAMNSKVRSKNKHGVTGVYQLKRGNYRWLARITFNGLIVHLGTFFTKSEAVFARKMGEVEHFGEFRRRRVNND